ncbi:hypothetical protein IFM89_013500 [Coptis chinensis]|uniref:Neprosin PEP catalytic domain-containing protein n=1 Tax=Coptis chinensis TaxID=261450 RepID=A0A835H3H2_9MAGN|nr:hypothetical protein IFM89_013500 [Coptis chinensis]
MLQPNPMLVNQPVSFLLNEDFTSLNDMRLGGLCPQPLTNSIRQIIRKPYQQNKIMWVGHSKGNLTAKSAYSADGEPETWKSNETGTQLEPDEDAGTITKDDDLELERQLKRLNKPYVKTIKTEVDDIYDCIDIRKQPSLDHPLLQNHEIQASGFVAIMHPTTCPKRMYSKTGMVDKHNVAQKDLITVDCPEGTVPIRRIERQDLIRARSFTESYGTYQPSQSTPLSPGEHVAILRSKTMKVVHGIAGYLSLHNLSQWVKPGQSSSAHMWIESRLGNNVSSLQTGWMVSPQFYGDTKTRLFVFSKFNNNKGCFNLLCSNFVQINSRNPVDIVFNKTSEIDKEPFVIPIRIFHDKGTHNWWLQVNDDVNVGYWPSGTFPDMNNGASYVAWGGLAQGLTYVPSPPLGNGNLPDPDSPDATETAYIRLLQIFDLSDWLNISENDVEEYVDNYDCYDVKYMKYQGEAKGHVMYYGGHGGNCGN